MNLYPIPPINVAYFNNSTIQHPFKVNMGAGVLTPSDLNYLKFRIKRNPADEDPLVFKDLAGGGIIPIDGPNGVYSAVVPVNELPEQSDTKQYFYYIESKENANNGRVSIVMWGTMYIYLP